MIPYILPANLTNLAEQVVNGYSAAKLTIVTAESCTGGLVAAAITEIPGSSQVLHSGLVTYSNEAKINLLKVNPEIIDTFGAVSIAVVWAMAQGALERSGADVALAISGIAGPDGGTIHKPVGTVVFALAKRGDTPEDIISDTVNFEENGGRAQIRLQATDHALNLLLDHLA
jgi:nicotinamide-nucleotide amidase